MYYSQISNRKDNAVPILGTKICCLSLGTPLSFTNIIDLDIVESHHLGILICSNYRHFWTGQNLPVQNFDLVIP